MSRLLACLLLLPATLPAQSIATNSPTPLSVRVTGYTIDAKIDTDKKSLDATETLTYKNLTGQPLTYFPFHLYLNAFHPQSSYMREAHFGGTRDGTPDGDYPKKKLGSITVSKISADGFGDLQLRFTAPDDGNMEDHTVAEAALPHPLAPGDTITFHIIFHDQFPESIARNGYKRDFLMGGQWYPKPGVFWHGAWNCHQYHSVTEFFSDFATFHVTLTVPQRFVLGASGVPTGQRDNPDGTRTQSFYGEDIGDFAWAISPNFTVTTGTFLSSMGPVQVRVLALKAHPNAGQRYLKILLASMKKFDEWYGPYPYKVLTLIDPEPGSAAEGMEYPTLITGGTSNLEPGYLTELVSEHEFGHQYWYGMVATNEFEDAWLDEGINSYTEGNVLGAILGQKTSFLNYSFANMSDSQLLRAEYLATPDYDPVVRYAWQFYNNSSYAGVTYGKTATLLKTLEGIVGADTMREAMHVYFMRYRFTHPTTEDFLQTIEEVAIKDGRATRTLADMSSNGSVHLLASRTEPAAVAILPAALQGATAGMQPLIGAGSSLRPYFNQAVYGTQVLDYAVEDVESGPDRWWLPDSKGSEKRDLVTIHRKGDFILPVTLEVVFSDGTKLREHWDGADRWKTFTYVRPATIVSAEIDPDHTVSLDKNLFNNSYTTKADPVPARKLTTGYATYLQALSQILTWLV
jgi:hypothetical protein